ncbi:TetR family transcriptional regulator [Sphingobium sp. MK2]|uniref:TetR/AcrR family transcriptional regulator n=1 Tax=Sphingobium sp. MK2 TaxID=3116540 RepID=UPI0032E35F1F
MNALVVDAIEQLVREGLSVSEACERQGISRPTYYRWVRSKRTRSGESVVTGATVVIEKLLDAGETLFARDGFAVSLREISKSAGVTHSLMLYHFREREHFVGRIVDRRLAEFNSLRIDYLDGILSRDGRPQVDDIVDAWMVPGLRAAFSSDPGMARYVRLIGRIAQSDEPAMQRIAERAFTDLHRRFLDAFALTLPDLAPDEIMWRYTALTGLYLNMTQNPNRIERISGGTIVLDDPDSAIAMMRPFLVAMMKN